MNYRSKTALVCMVGFAALSNGCGKQNGGLPTQKRRITLASFDQISEGMTMEQVTAVLGQPQDGTGVENGEPRMTLVGVEVSRSARWTEDSATDKRQIQIGFNDGKVAAVIYRQGNVLKMKPVVPADSFRLIIERRPADILRVVVDFGSPEGKLMAFGVGESMDRLDGFGAATPQKTTIFTVTGRLVDNTDAEGQSLEVVLQLLGPKTTSTSTSKFAVDDGKRISDVLATVDDNESGLYKPGEPIALGIITGKDGKKRTIILHVAEKPENSDADQ